jgi:hypothetical protein
MTIYCPKCRQVVEGGDAINGMVQCPECSDWFPAPKSFIDPALAPPLENKQPRRDEGTSSRDKAFLAGALIVIGVIGLIYFLFLFNVSMPVPGQDYSVNNVGLLQDRQNGLIVSAVIFLAGIILAAVRQRANTEK